MSTNHSCIKILLNGIRNIQIVKGKVHDYSRERLYQLKREI